MSIGWFYSCGWTFLNLEYAIQKSKTSKVKFVHHTRLKLSHHKLVSWLDVTSEDDTPSQPISISNIPSCRQSVLGEVPTRPVEDVTANQPGKINSEMSASIPGILECSTDLYTDLDTDESPSNITDSSDKFVSFTDQAARTSRFGRTIKPPVRFSDHAPQKTLFSHIC